MRDALAQALVPLPGRERHRHRRAERRLEQRLDILAVAGAGATNIAAQFVDDRDPAVAECVDAARLVGLVIAERQRLGRSYLEFLRVPSMSVGVYFLPVGGLDPQKPHTENELYYVMKGRGSVQVNRGY